MRSREREREMARRGKKASEPFHNVLWFIWVLMAHKVSNFFQIIIFFIMATSKKGHLRGGKKGLVFLHIALRSGTTIVRNNKWF